MSVNPSPHHPLEQEPPPLRRPPTYCPLWNGCGKEPVGFWLLEDGIHWWDVHYVDDRARPCLVKLGRCAPCEDAWKPRRTGFICALRAGTGGRYVLRITDYAYRNCLALATPGARLRGMPVVLTRRTKAKNAPWVVTIPPRAPVPDLPFPVNTIDQLSLIWGIDLNRLSYLPPADGDVTPLLRPYIGRRKGECE